MAAPQAQAGPAGEVIRSVSEHDRHGAIPSHRERAGQFPASPRRPNQVLITGDLASLEHLEGAQSACAQLQLLRASSASTNNHFAFIEDVAGNAGIAGVSTNPLTWGVPSLSFSTFSRSATPTPAAARYALGARICLDEAVSATHVSTWRRCRDGSLAGPVRSECSGRLYVHGSLLERLGSGSRRRLRLCGLPPGTATACHRELRPGRGQHARPSPTALYLQDDFRIGANLTLNLGLRYELVLPFVETNGRMVNLDAAPGFIAVVPVLSDQAGVYSGHFPKGLIRTDANNIAPRVGFAWRVAQGTIVRGGYGISYNAGSYSSMARTDGRSTAVCHDQYGHRQPAGALEHRVDPMATASPDQIANDYGVDVNYVLGMVQTATGDLSKDLTQAWNVGVNYTHIIGSHLDIVRAPNRGPSGLLLPNVQPFEWQSSEGGSRLHAAEFRLTRRPLGGIGGGVTYTLARSRDNASTTGGATVVAQDDKDLQAEWSLSSFSRRHQLSANLNVDLPFGRGRRFFTNGGFWSAIFGGWRFTTGFVAQSGAPITVRVSGAASSVAGGTNGTLRANYDGSPIQIANPTIDRFFNTAAFSIPAPGTVRQLATQPGDRSRFPDPERAVFA